MSISAAFDDGEQIQFATNTGWGDVVRWVDELPDEFVKAIHLTAHGYVTDLPALHAQLTAALESHPPADDVRHTVEALLAALEANMDSDAVFITDGMGPSDDDDPAQFDEGHRSATIPDEITDRASSAYRSAVDDAKAEIANRFKKKRLIYDRRQP